MSEHKNVMVKCPHCGTMLSIEPAEEAKEEHEEDAREDKAENLRTTIEKAMDK